MQKTTALKFKTLVTYSSVVNVFSNGIYSSQNLQRLGELVRFTLINYIPL